VVSLQQQLAQAREELVSIRCEVERAQALADNAKATYAEVVTNNLQNNATGDSTPHGKPDSCSDIGMEELDEQDPDLHEAK
jgi:hypothetical protein